MKKGTKIAECLEAITGAIQSRDEEQAAHNLHVENSLAALHGKLDAVLKGMGIQYSEMEQLQQDFRVHLGDRSKHANGN